MIKWQHLSNMTKIILVILGIILVLTITYWESDSNKENNEYTSTLTQISEKPQTTLTTIISKNEIIIYIFLINILFIYINIYSLNNIDKTPNKSNNKSIKGQLKKRLKSDSNVRCLASLPSGSLAVCGYSRNISIWNTEMGVVVKILSGHTDWVQCLKVLTDGTLASGSDDQTINIWNPQSGKLLRTISGHESDVTALEQLNNGLLASGSSDSTIKIWNITTGELVKNIEMTSSISQFLVLVNGNLVIRLDRTISYIIILDVKTGDEVRRLETIDKSYDSVDSVINMVLLNDGRLAVSERNITIWNLCNADDSELVRIISPNDQNYFVWSLQLLGDGSLASGFSNGEIKIWDVTSGQLLKSFQHSQKDYYVVDLMSILSDGSLVCASNYWPFINIWN